MSNDIVEPIECSPEKPLVRIRPSRGWRGINMRELWQFRELLLTLLVRDVTVRYKQTILGVLWAVLQPLLMMAVFTLVMSAIGRTATGNLPYPIFFYSGYLLWYFFSQSLSMIGNSIVVSQQLITKVYFPRLAIPIAALGAPAVDFGFAVLILIAMMCYYHVKISWTLLLAPVIVLLTALAALGTGAVLAALNASYRDFKHTIPFLVQIGMFATPIIYVDTWQLSPSQSQSEVAIAASPADQSADEQSAQRRQRIQRLAGWLNLNPLMGLIGAFRAALLGRAIPWGALSYSALTSLAIFALGCLYFRRAERTFADVV